MSALMFTYPVHQAADILSCRANLVPVGQDQLPHVELTRTIARRFNERYSPQRPFFRLPEPLLGAAALLPGLDGQKMSKSRGNTIPLAATEAQTARLIRAARTDGQRHITYDPAVAGVSSLILLAAMCRGQPPASVAEEIGDRKAARLQGSRHRGRQRALPRNPRKAPRAGRRPGIPAGGAPARQRAGCGACRGHPGLGAAADADELLTELKARRSY